MEIETANFIGLSQAGAPVRTRGARGRPAGGGRRKPATGGRRWVEIDAGNARGWRQAGAPVMTRGSSRSPARDATRTTSIVVPTKASGRLEDQARPSGLRGPDALADCAAMPHPLLPLLYVCAPSSSPLPLLREHLSLGSWSCYTSRF